ncbi:Saccharopine dehydrogenase-domain-containing protein [Cladochytrium replicatum]|nr:Saccharopine dehydrogenase-domain-containing protein [Cladochytrium replicatum]
MLEGPKKYDLLVYGATGFTGQRVVKCIAEHDPPSTGRPFQWAISGRDAGRLGKFLDTVNFTNSLIPRPDILIADVRNAAQLEDAFALTRLVINCVGPFRFFGLPVVEACLKTGADYIDINGEPEFAERTFYVADQAAKLKSLTIVPCCGFDCIPGDLGLLFLKREFYKRGFVATQAEMFVTLLTPKGSTANWATFESMVNGVAHQKDLETLRKQIGHLRLPVAGRKLRMKSRPYFDKRVGRWAVVFSGADPSIVRMGQQISEAHRRIGADRPSAVSPPLRALPATQFAAYITVQSTLNLIGFMYFGLSVFTLAKWKWGRDILYKYHQLFDFGYFSKDGPSETELSASSFVETFFARGYRMKQKPQEGQAAIVEEEWKGKDPELEIVATVAGPEVGYVATPLCIIASAYILLEEKSKGLIPAGVHSPASAFGDTGIIDRLNGYGVDFSVVKVTELGAPKARL